MHGGAHAPPTTNSTTTTTTWTSVPRFRDLCLLHFVPLCLSFFSTPSLFPLTFAFPLNLVACSPWVPIRAVSSHLNSSPKYSEDKRPDTAMNILTIMMSANFVDTVEDSHDNPAKRAQQVRCHAILPVVIQFTFFVRSRAPSPPCNRLQRNEHTHDMPFAVQLKREGFLAKGANKSLKGHDLARLRSVRAAWPWGPGVGFSCLHQCRAHKFRMSKQTPKQDMPASGLTSLCSRYFERRHTSNQPQRSGPTRPVVAHSCRAFWGPSSFQVLKGVEWL